jgi:hypothetical protein
MKDLGNSQPVILAFGNDAYALDRKHLRPEEYSRLVKLPHYSHQISKEAYKIKVDQALDNAESNQTSHGAAN